jgi:hypothetical protein
MGLVNKVQHTLNCINDITNALKFHNINMNNITLKEYGNIIRKFLVNQKTSKNIILYNLNTPNIINKNKISIKTLLIYGNNNNYIFSHKISSCLNKNVITYDKELQIVKTNYLINMATPIAVEE